MHLMSFTKCKFLLQYCNFFIETFHQFQCFNYCLYSSDFEIRSNFVSMTRFVKMFQ